LKKKAIPIFNALYPNCQALFAFDHSSNHTCFAPDTLIASSACMNGGPGDSKNRLPRMRNGYFGPNKIPQEMNFDNNHPQYPGQPKGIKQILFERDLLPAGLNVDCTACKKSRNCDPDRSSRTNCCLRRILAIQPDFREQRSYIVETVEEAGHLCIFYPKFHCELNFIEMYWGATKRYARDNCQYTWEGLKETVPVALDSVSLSLIRKFSRKSLRYMDAYHKGLTGLLAEYAVQKYKSHRRIPKGIEELQEELENKS
jgi:hypothetical protein